MTEETVSYAAQLLIDGELCGQWPGDVPLPAIGDEISRAEGKIARVISRRWEIESAAEHMVIVLKIYAQLPAKPGRVSVAPLRI